MDDAAYKEWWALHVRHARGESLSQEELLNYEQGRDQIYSEEDLSTDMEELRRLRSHIQEMETEHAGLMEQYQRLKAKAELLEAKLNTPQRQYIGASQ